MVSSCTNQVNTMHRHNANKHAALTRPKSSKLTPGTPAPCKVTSPDRTQNCSLGAFQNGRSQARQIQEPSGLHRLVNPHAHTGRQFFSQCSLQQATAPAPNSSQPYVTETHTFTFASCRTSLRKQATRACSQGSPNLFLAGTQRSVGARIARQQTVPTLQHTQLDIH